MLSLDQKRFKMHFYGKQYLQSYILTNLELHKLYLGI